jgi:hypothetical protein
MKKKSSKISWINNKNLFIIIILLLIYIIYYFFETTIYTDEYISHDLEKDGFCILYNPEYCLSEKTPSEQFKKDVLDELPQGYEFIDYSYIINNTSLFTFHRDVTSSQFIYKTKYPIYTAIIYKYSGDLLSLCPGSHSTYPFVNSHIINIHGKKGTAFLFNSDILHSGCENNCERPEIVQYKICHHDDLYLLEHLIGKHVEKKDVCSMSFYKRFLRKMSYYFEMPINVFFYPFMIEKKNENTIIGKIQSYVPFTFYNNT